MKKKKRRDMKNVNDEVIRHGKRDAGKTFGAMT